MYAYFGQNGSLLEIVFQGSANAGSSDYNKIFAFWDNDGWTDASSTYSATITFYDDEGSVLGTADLAMSVSSAKVPSTDDYDYTFFKENTFYKFATISVPAVVTAVNGWVRAVVRVFNGGTEVKALQDLTFQVNGSYVYDAVLTQSQYDYLMQLASSNQTEIGNIESWESLGTFENPLTALQTARSYFWSANINVTRAYALISNSEGSGTVYYFRLGSNWLEYRYEFNGDFKAAGSVYSPNANNSISYTYAFLGKENTFTNTNEFHGEIYARNNVYFSSNARFNYNVALGTSGSDNSKSLDVYFTTNLRGPVNSYTILPGNMGFTLGSAVKYWHEVYTDDLFVYGVITDGFYEWTLPSATGTLALLSDVASAKQEAITTAGTNADTKIDALKTELDFSNGAFGDIVADTLTVREFTADHTITIDSAIQSAFFEYLKGNTTSLGSNYAGSIFTKYDGTYDSFFGLHNDTIVFGDCNATRDSDGNVTGITPVSLIALAGRDDSANLIDGDLLMWDSTALKIVDAGLNPATMASQWSTISDTWTNTIMPTWTNTIVPNATKMEEATRELLRSHPNPITEAEYANIHDNGYYCNWKLDGDGHWVMSVDSAIDPDAVYSFDFQSDVIYSISDAYDMGDVEADISALETDKQDTLVSGTNIKTINNASILGAGNIALPSFAGKAGTIENTTGSSASVAILKSNGWDMQTIADSDTLAVNDAIFIMVGSTPSTLNDASAFGNMVIPTATGFEVIL